jgi:type IV pilus biogenesis protein CpaD/CtpE
VTRHVTTVCQSPICLRARLVPRIIQTPDTMTCVAQTLARGLAVLLFLASFAPALACSTVTTVTGAAPIVVEARPPAPPLPDLPAVPQPPPPPRVTIEADVLQLDEALGFDEAGKLSAEHQDILTEVARWLATHEDVLVLSIEVQSGGEGSRRARDKRNQAMAKQIVDALVAEGIDATRLLPVSTGKSEDALPHVVLRVTQRAEAGVTIEVEE